jgi:flagellar hook-associated protein 2
LTAKNSGSGFKIEDLSDLSGGMLGEFGLNLGSTRTAFVQNESGTDTAGFVHDLALLNSKISFNGLNIERNSNSISDLVVGVTLNLKSVMSVDDNDVTVDVANDVTAVKARIDEFITSFNDVYNYVKSNTSSSDGIRGVLLGDASGSSILSLLSSTAHSPISGLGSGTINSLTEMGITFNNNTGLSITNSDQLNNALANNIEEVEQTFNSDSGIAANLYNRLLPYTGFNGYLTARKNTIDGNIKSTTDSITRIQTKIEKDSQVLRNRYVQLQSQLSTLLNSTGSFGADLFS